MLNLKHFGVAAALALTAAGAMASNFRSADQVYLPIAGHATGGSGTFISDIYLSNLSDDAVDVSVILAVGPTGAQQNFTNAVTLQPRERREFIDFFGNVLHITNGLGQVVFNACKSGADCQNTQDAYGYSPNFRNISVESRIYSALGNNTANGTTGQDIAGQPWYSFVSMDQGANNLNKVFITGVRNTPDIRTNIGLTNASQYSSTQLRVTLYDSLGNQIGTPYVETLAPLGQAQRSIVAMFPTFTTATTATGAWVSIEQISATPTPDSPSTCGSNGCPGFFAYGAALDNKTGDPTTLEAQYFVQPSADVLIALYPNSAGKQTYRRAARH